MTNAVIKQGMVIKIGNGEETETFTSLGEIVDIDPPELGMNIHNVTNMDTANNMEESIAGRKTVGDTTVTVNWNPDNTTHAQLLTDWGNRTKRNCQITGPDAADFQWDFKAYFKIKLDAGSGDSPFTATVTLTGICELVLTS